MKIDRTLFLALTVALTGLACVEEPPALDPSSADGSSGVDAPAPPEPVAPRQTSRVSSHGRPTPDTRRAPVPAEAAPQPEDDGYVPFGDGFHDFGTGFERFHPSSEGSSLFRPAPGPTTRSRAAG